MSLASLIKGNEVLAKLQPSDIGLYAAKLGLNAESLITNDLGSSKNVGVAVAELDYDSKQVDLNKPSKAKLHDTNNKFAEILSQTPDSKVVEALTNKVQGITVDPAGPGKGRGGV